MQPDPTQPAAVPHLSQHLAPSPALTDEHHAKRQRILTAAPLQNDQAPQYRPVGLLGASTESLPSGGMLNFATGTGAEGQGNTGYDPATEPNDNLYFGPKSRWRKYGEKSPAGQERMLKTYFRCTHPGCPAKRTVTRAPGQPMEDGTVEMVALHNHTETEFQAALAEGIPRQHQRFKSDAATAPVGEEVLQGSGMTMLPTTGVQDVATAGSANTQPVVNAQLTAMNPTSMANPTAPMHPGAPTGFHVKQRMVMPHVGVGQQPVRGRPTGQAGGIGGPLSDIVLVVKVVEHETSLFSGREQIERIARNAGARVMKNLSKSVTHVLVVNKQANDPAYQSAYSGMTIVDEAWLREKVGLAAHTQDNDQVSRAVEQAAASTPGVPSSSNDPIVAWCPICHKGFTTSQGMGGHYGRCKASMMSEQQTGTTPTAGTTMAQPSSQPVGLNPTAAGQGQGLNPTAPSIPAPPVGNYVCEHGWLAAECSECNMKHRPDEMQVKICVPVPPEQMASAPGADAAATASSASIQDIQDLSSLFTDDFCVKLNNLLESQPTTTF